MHEAAVNIRKDAFYFHQMCLRDMHKKYFPSESVLEKLLDYGEGNKRFKGG